MNADVIGLLTRETERCTAKKDYHSFRQTSEEMKVYWGILIMSGYHTIHRPRLHWNHEPDTLKEVIFHQHNVITFKK